MHKKKDPSEERREVKNQKIAETMKKTLEKRKSQDCKVFELKINERRLNKAQKEAMFMLFVEAKWFYNAVLGSGTTPSDYDSKVKSVLVKYPGGFQERPLEHLSAAMKQHILADMTSSIKSLSTHKKKGDKVGKLKFVSEYTSIGLKQYNHTHQIDFKRNRVSVQKVGWMRVHGLKQIPDGADIANARLVKRASGYYLMLTVFLDKQPEKTGEATTVVGVDMGVATSLTLSNGYEFSAYVEEPERLKRFQRKLAKQDKSSNSYQKTVTQLRREYEKMGNKKNDVANKIVSNILKNDAVFFQDEILSQWKVRWGKKIHHSVLGRVKESLKRADNAYMLNRSVATTQTCTCGRKNKLPLSERTYECECGRKLPRDVHSAQMMVILGKDLVPTGRREFKLVESAAAWDSVEFYEHSVKPEATTL